MGSSNDILDMYLYETNTLLEQLDSIVLAAEQSNTFSQDDINEIFRIMHTIKGSSAMMEFNTLMTVAHRIEDLFFIIRDKSMDVVPEQDRPLLFDMLFQSIDYFRDEISKIENNEPLTENIDSFLQNINSFIAKIQPDKDRKAASEEPAKAPAKPEETENGENKPKAENESPKDKSVAPDPGVNGNPAFRYGIHVYFDEGCGMENLRAFIIVNSIRDFCTDDDFVYEPADVENHSELSEYIIENGFIVRFRKADDRAKTVSVVTGSGSVRSYQTFDTSAQKGKSQKASKKQSSTGKPAQQAASGAGAADRKKVSAGPSGAQHTKESLISVNLAKLDQLMAVVGEIVITESMVTSSPDLKGMKLDTFTKSARQLRKLTDELQDVTMALRMVPVSGTFQKMNRIVRDMSKKLGKKAKLTIIGEETEVDKSIVDNIGDPIMHIIRNSMDHGIEESAEERVAAGKNPVGEIVLSARDTGSEVIIEIQDDGQGVDCDAVLAKAQKAGLANPETEYSKKEILNFLMMPGFSTNTEVTEYSGRGVGMDVVKKNVEEMGGTVSITSERGKGMTTTLKIPLTMAIMDGMEVTVGESIFTVPIINIRQMFKVTPSEIIHDTRQGEMIKRMDKFYPIIRIRNAYKLPDGIDNLEEGIVMWVESGEVSYCLFVDELLGEQQVVVKPLPGFVNSYNIKNCGISGCTILGDGNISIILDVANLYAAAQG